MKLTEIREELEDWAKLGENGAPAPIEHFHFDATSNRWIVDGNAFSKPQVEAFLIGLDKGYEWVKRLSEHVEANRG